MGSDLISGFCLSVNSVSMKFASFLIGSKL